jgi:hypothetical protein
MYLIPLDYMPEMIMFNIFYHHLKNYNVPKMHRTVPFKWVKCMWCDRAIPLIGVYPKEYNSGYNKGTCTPMFIATLFTITKL